MQRAGVKASGKGSARRRHRKVVRPRKPGYGIQQYHNILVLLRQPLCPLQHQLRYAAMVFGQLIKGGIYHIPLYGALHIRNLLGPLVYKQHDKVYIGIICAYGVCQLFKQRRLSRLRGRHYKAPLPLAYGAYQVNHPQRYIPRLRRVFQPYS